MATNTYTEIAIQICVLTAASEMPKNDFIRRCDLIHLKKQLHLPSAFIQIRYGSGIQIEIVGQESEALICFFVVEFYSS